MLMLEVSMRGAREPSQPFAEKKSPRTVCRGECRSVVDAFLTGSGKEIY
jgi:hypothetical protein